MDSVVLVGGVDNVDNRQQAVHLPYMQGARANRSWVYPGMAIEMVGL